MSIEQIQEIVDPSVVKVDRDAGVVRGVRVLGLKSKNGRTYTKAAVSRAVGLYEGVRVNYDHVSFSDPQAQRTVSDRAGWLSGVHEDDDGGLSGDLHLLLADPRANKVLEAAERRPELFGLSHTVDARVERNKGESVVEEIRRVCSVDIVSDPASTRSLFESETIGEKTVKTKVSEIISRAFGLRGVQILTEEDTPMPEVAEVPVEVPAEATSEDQVKAAFRAMVIAAFDDASLDSKATVQKIKEILQAQEKLMGVAPDSGPGAENVVPEVPTVHAATESIQRKIDQLGAGLTTLAEEMRLSRTKPDSLRKAEGEYKPPASSKEFVARVFGR